jgi:hypothetical protein
MQITNTQIHSVKRTRDNKVFTIVDSIPVKGEIVEFKLHQSGGKVEIVAVVSKLPEVGKALQNNEFSVNSL